MITIPTRTASILSYDTDIIYMSLDLPSGASMASRKREVTEWSAEKESLLNLVVRVDTFCLCWNSMYLSVIGGSNLAQARQTNGFIVGYCWNSTTFQRILVLEGIFIIHQSPLALCRSQKVNQLFTLHSCVSVSRAITVKLIVYPVGHCFNDTLTRLLPRFIKEVITRLLPIKVFIE